MVLTALALYRGGGMAESQMSLLTEVGERVSSDFFKAGGGEGDVKGRNSVFTALAKCGLGLLGPPLPLRERVH